MGECVSTPHIPIDISLLLFYEYSDVTSFIGKHTSEWSDPQGESLQDPHFSQDPHLFHIGILYIPFEIQTMCDSNSHSRQCGSCQQLDSDDPLAFTKIFFASRYIACFLFAARSHGFMQLDCTASSHSSNICNYNDSVANKGVI
jgi:hypothetical protein